jgi:gamma-glutamyltranspeptidase / glutathione hydrolase
MSREIGNIGWQATSSSGAIAAGGAGAVDAGMQILTAGGNAADAAAATIFALQVTDHGACCIGGEVPLLIYDAGSQQVKSLSGMGRAPLSPAAIDWYMANGIPGPGDMKMAPVPSVVDLCITTLQQYGTMSLAQVIEPTLAILDAGTREWEPKLARTLRRMAEEESLTRGSRQEKLQAAGDRFYGRNTRCSDIAEELEAEFIGHGSFLRMADLQAHHTRIEDPVKAAYRGYTVCKCGTWTQGPALLQALRLVEGFDVRSLGHMSADFVHLAVEALKLAFADRDTWYGDPEFVDVPLSELLGDAYTDLRRPLIDMQAASAEARPGDPLAMQAVTADGVFRPGGPGTTTCVVADRWGNVVSATPSANVDTTRMDGGDAGVTYGNRLRSLNTTPGHPNCIQPGKRPRITLTPTLILKQDKPAFAISVAGGDRQDQAALQMIMGAIDFGMSPSQVVRAPRFSSFHHQNSFDPSPHRDTTFTDAGALEINDTVSQSTREELTRRGHPLLVRERTVGTPVMLSIDGDSIEAAGDPDAARHAAGL